MGKAKLRRADARAILHSSDSVRVLAVRYDVSTSTIRDILHGRKWKTVDGPRRKPSSNNGVKWEPTPEQVEEICAAISVRGSWADGASAGGVSVPTLKALARRSEAGAAIVAVVEAARRVVSS